MTKEKKEEFFDPCIICGEHIPLNNARLGIMKDGKIYSCHLWHENSEEYKKLIKENFNKDEKK